MKTYVYIDAFNLYFGCVKGTPTSGLIYPNCAGSFFRDTKSSESSISQRMSEPFLTALMLHYISKSTFAPC